MGYSLFSFFPVVEALLPDSQSSFSIFSEPLKNSDPWLFLPENHIVMQFWSAGSISC